MIRFAAAAAAVGLALALASRLPAQDAAASWLVATWDHTLRDTAGNPEQLARVEYALATPTEVLGSATTPTHSLVVDLRTERDEQQLIATLQGLGVPADIIALIGSVYRLDLVTELRQGLAPGQYRLWARVADLAGNWSAWAQDDALLTVADTVPPEPPQLLEVRARLVAIQNQARKIQVATTYALQQLDGYLQELSQE